MPRSEHEEPPLPESLLVGLEADRLPRPEIEERAVTALLRRSASLPRSRLRPATWLMTLVAAGIAFIIGVGVGKRRAESEAVGPAAGAASLEQSARHYLDALSRAPASQSGIALASFRAAAEQIARFAPNDATDAIRLALDASVASAPLVPRRADAGITSLIWY